MNHTLDITIDELQEFVESEELDIIVENSYSSRATNSIPCLGVIGTSENIERFQRILAFHCGYALGKGSHTRINDALQELYEAADSDLRVTRIRDELIAYWPGVKLAPSDS
jgi:hypothetical protein